jgi:hypothetical protein
MFSTRRYAISGELPAPRFPAVNFQNEWIPALTQAVVCALLCSGPSITMAHADTIITTAEAAGAVNTTASFTSVGVETFDAGYPLGLNASINVNFGTALGSYGLISGMGANISSAIITGANIYGGAGHIGRYAANYPNPSNNPITITLNQNVSYFGLWISAMNSGNVVSLYNNSALLFQFNSSSMASLVGDCANPTNSGRAYCGNPSINQTTMDPKEPFAFVNFYDATGTFNIINISGPNFETDNYTAGNYSSITGAQINAPQLKSIPDIISANNRNNINSSGVNILSNAETSSAFKNRFDGGTLQVDAPLSTSASFTITSNNGYIDQLGRSATFTGLISDDGSSHGCLIISNSADNAGGFIALTNPNNSHSGGTQVQSGATLSIPNAGALGSGGLDLVGSSTTPAILVTTANMTIANPITVTGDPVFNVASGTTTLISSPIANGASAGDVVVSGGAL